MITKTEYEFLVALVKSHFDALDITGVNQEMYYYKAQCELYEKLRKLAEM